MPYAYQIHKQDAAYFLTPSVVELAHAFMKNKHKQILCDSLNHCVDTKGLEIFSYVIMSSHMHMMVRAKNNNLSDVIRDFKKFSSRKLIETLNSNPEIGSTQLLEIYSTGGSNQKKKSAHQVWQYNNHAEEVYSPNFTLSKIRYIHNNPVEAGLVGRPEEYYYSSARDYSGIQGPVKVSLINLHNLF